MLFGWTISRGLESAMMSRIIFFAVILVLAQGLKSLLNYLQWMVQQKVGQDLVRDIRDQLYTQLQSLPVSFYKGMPDEPDHRPTIEYSETCRPHRPAQRWHRG